MRYVKAMLGLVLLAVLGAIMEAVAEEWILEDPVNIHWGTHSAVIVWYLFFVRREDHAA